MPVRVGYDEDANVIEMVFTGRSTLVEVQSGMTQAGTLGAEMLTNRYLIDCLESEGEGSAFDVLSVAEFLASVPPDVIEREAILLPKDAAAAEDMQFFETAARNRGLDVRVFSDRAEALTWLVA